MSLNFYAAIDSFKNDNKDNTSITLKAGAGDLDNMLDKLRELKGDPVVSITFESATIYFDKEVDGETQQDTTLYKQDDDGIWKSYKNGNTTLDGVGGTDTKRQGVTADVVDKFLLTQKYEVGDEADDSQLAKSILGKMAEGYSYDEIAEYSGMSASEMLDYLNEKRQKYAPYAVAWIDKLNAENDEK